MVIEDDKKGSAMQQFKYSSGYTILANDLVQKDKFKYRTVSKGDTYAFSKPTVFDKKLYFQI